MFETKTNLEDLAVVLAALAHASRLHILMVVLVHGGTMSAGDIAGRFSHSWPTTSRHLRVLEQAGLLQFDKQGRTRVYRVNHEKLHVVRDWLRWFDHPPREIAPPAAVRPEYVLREIALAYPESLEEQTEQKRIMKVHRRPFLLLEADGSRLQMSARLPTSRAAAIEHPFVNALQYRFGKNDWICATFQADDEIPLELLWEWIDESYRSVAPGKLLARLPSPPPEPQIAAGHKHRRDP